MASVLQKVRLPLFSEAFTCACRVSSREPYLTRTACPRYSTDIKEDQDFSDEANHNKDYVINKEFINRNPRNLEYMAIARKREGWGLQYPRRDFYNKLHFQVTNEAIHAWVEHASGTKIVMASTREWSLRQYLYSARDVSAAENLGQVFADRCLKTGITKLFVDETSFKGTSEKEQAFLKGLNEAEIELTEPEVVKPEYRPGIDYDGPNRYAEPKEMKDDYQIIE